MPFFKNFFLWREASMAIFNEPWSLSWTILRQPECEDPAFSPANMQFFTSKWSNQLNCFKETSWVLCFFFLHQDIFYIYYNKLIRTFLVTLFGRALWFTKLWILMFPKYSGATLMVSMAPRLSADSAFLPTFGGVIFLLF